MDIGTLLNIQINIIFGSWKEKEVADFVVFSQ